MTLGDWKKVSNKAGIRMMKMEKGSPWQNRTKTEIWELKHHVIWLMESTDTPAKLWDLCKNYTVQLRNMLTIPLPRLNGRTPQELIMGNTLDIFDLVEFE
jgi:hypothetical protein